MKMPHQSNQKDESKKYNKKIKHYDSDLKSFEHLNTF
jgi:hypothetical protein